MCGIVGYVGKTPALGEDTFIQIRDLLAHRGPDNAGFWQSPDGGVKLGNRRLAILDLSPAGHQPMVDEANSLVIVHNGEIYNYVELRLELQKSGHCFRSHSDTEVLLAAYKQWGSDCLRHLNGMFAFAIWDERRQELFAARDRFGEKPFYYHYDPGRAFLIFASEIKAILASGLISPKPNYKTIYRYLAHHEIDVGTETVFKGISALPPAHALSYSRAQGKLKIWRYWDLDPEAEIRLPNDTAYAERFLELLADAVRIRLRSDVPVGSSLSGGLDSSTIVCLIAKELKGGIQKTFSARFDDPHYDEGKHIQKVLEWANVEGHMVYPDPARLPEEIEKLTWHQEQPFFSTSIYAQWNVMRLAKEQGVTVLLDGQGGDETLGGYHFYFGSYFRDLFLRLRWMTLMKSLYSYARKHGSASLPVIAFTFLPKRLQHPLRRLVRPLAIAPELAQAGVEDVEHPLLLHAHNFKSALQEALYETLTRTMLPALLRYADRNSMAFSREVRLPFLDHRLVEFLFSIPVDQKIRQTTTKFILRNAISGVVPEEIRQRKDKLGFAPPEALWMKGPLRAWIDEILRSPRFRQRGWLDPKAVDRVWEEFLNGRDTWHSLIWRWVSLEIWARVFLDNDWRLCSEK
ncbi:MAG: asparagine synthase (glutamine-hydrolyzing) [Candidatus Caldarchaeum sp.]